MRRKSEDTEAFLQKQMGEKPPAEPVVVPCTTSALFRFATFRQKFWFSVGILLSVVSGIIMPMNSLYSGSIAKIYLDSANAMNDQAAYDAVMSIVWIYAISAAVQFVCSGIQQYLLPSTTAELVETLRKEYLSAVLRSSASTLDTTSSGKLSSVLNENIDTIRDGLGDKIGLIVRTIAMYIFAVAISFSLNWKATLCMLPLGPLCFILMAIMGKYLIPAIVGQMTAAAGAGAVAEQAIMNVRTVASCNGQSDMVKKYSSALSAGGMKAVILRGFFEGTFVFLLYAFSIITVVVGVWDAQTGGAPKGSVLSAVGLVATVSFFMGTIGPHVMALLKARLAAAIIYKTIDESPPANTTEVKPLKLRGEIEFDSVRFEYATRDVTVLQDLSFTAKAGQSVALTGHSGSGKSTAVSLLTKLYSCTEGAILIDGFNIENIDTRALRMSIGIVPQEPSLFNGTIRENIILGRNCGDKNTEEKRLLGALRTAHAYEFVMNLEKGYETVLGDGGITLSGGQKQRIAIARAILLDPAILILDEATSALDVHSETSVQEALTEARSGRTTIIIAHRLSTLKSADVIYVMDGGVVAEQGTHDSLIEGDGIYARMVARQSLVSDESPSTRQPQASLLRDRYVKSKSVMKSVSIEEKTKEKTRSPSSFFRLYTHGSYGRILTAVLLSMIRGMEYMCYVYIFSQIYAALAAPPSDYPPLLTMYAIFSFSLGVFLWIITTFAYYFSGKSSNSVITLIQRTILEKVLHRDAAFFDDPKTSNAVIATNLNQQSGALAAGLDGRMVALVWWCTSFCACLVRCILLEWKVGLYGLATGLIFVVALLILFVLMTNSMEREAREDRSPKLAIEVFTQTRIIQVMAVESYFEAKFDKMQSDVRHIRNKVAITKALTAALCLASVFTFGAVAFGFGAQFVLDGVLSGQALFMLGLASEFCGACLFNVNPVFPELMRANAAARILYSYFDLPDQIDGGMEKIQLQGSITVQDLHFAYPSRPEHEVTNSLSLSASAGESIALVGSSGCGKSTLITLLERFYVQQSGQIMLDLIDHRRISLTHLRKQIALIGQEPVLFEGSIMENILLGCEDGSLDDVRDACKTANAAQFIETLPEGYDTILSSMGRSLSGGQKQRIAIARALVRKPKILLMDEATSALDVESELVVQEALASASKGRTSISIAHRLSSIKDSSRIFFIEHGTVVESGTHEELTRANGKYAAYVTSQSLD